MIRVSFPLVCLASACAFPSSALCQTVPPNNIDNRVRQQTPPNTPQEQANALLSGDTDIILLRPTKLLTLFAGTGVSVTDNAMLRENGRRTDGYANVDVGFRLGTRIADTVDVYAGGTASSTRYFTYEGLGYTAFSGVVGADADIAGFTLSASYQPQLVYDRTVKTRQITQHRFRLGLSTSGQLGGVTISPTMAVERIEANPEAYRNWGGNAGLALSAPLSNRVPLIGFARIGYQRRVYDDYFEGILGVKRKDDNLTAGAGVQWQIRPNMSVTLSYDYQRNWSTSDVNRYRAHGGGLLISLSTKI